MPAVFLLIHLKLVKNGSRPREISVRFSRVGMILVIDQSGIDDGAFYPSVYNDVMAMDDTEFIHGHLANHSFHFQIRFKLANKKTAAIFSSH